MLTRLTTYVTPVIRLAAALMLIFAGFAAAYVVVSALPAAADHCGGESGPGQLDWSCHVDPEPDPTDPPDSPGGPPSCDLSIVADKGRADAARWCEGVNACFANIPSVVYPDPEDWPEDPPTPDSIYTHTQCFAPDSTLISAEYGWYTPDQPSPTELGWDAYGQLLTPAFTLAFNPPGRTYISLETWWWVEGPGTGEIVGTASFGMQAIGTPSHIEVDPGDGTQAFTCPWSAAQSGACNYTYHRASVAGTATAPDGSPAYAAQARLFYDVRYEQNGTVLQLPGLPTTLESPWMTTAVPVAEIHTTVIN